VPKNVGCEQTNHVPTMRVTNSCCVAGLAVPFAGVEHAANGSDPGGGGNGSELAGPTCSAPAGTARRAAGGVRTVELGALRVGVVSIVASLPPTAGRLTAESGTRADLDVACGWIALPAEIASTETATSAATGVAHTAMRRRIFLAGKDIWDQNFVMMIIPN
jgi:hypothetical protein